MAVEIEWKWGPMRVRAAEGDFSDVVEGINWICLAKDQGTENYAKKTGFLPAPPIDAENFVKLEDITADTINSWIQQSMDKGQIEAEAAEDLRKILTPDTKIWPVPPGV